MKKHELLKSIEIILNVDELQHSRIINFNKKFEMPEDIEKFDFKCEIYIKEMLFSLFFGIKGSDFKIREMIKKLRDRKLTDKDMKELGFTDKDFKL